MHPMSYLLSLDPRSFAIVKIVLDKLLIGGIVAIAAYFGAKTLDRHRTRNALSLELNKRRTESIAHAWELLGRYEIAVVRVGTALEWHREDPDPDSQADQLHDKRNAAQDAQFESISALRVVRYWMGPEVSEHLNAYHQAITSLFMALEENRANRDESQAIQDARSRVNSVFDNLNPAETLAKMSARI